MSGIIAGIDGSSHSQMVLEWAMRAAAARREPLTVITVEQVAASGWHGLVVFLPTSIIWPKRGRPRRTVQALCPE